MNEDLPQVIVCAGPPMCELMEDKAVEAMEAGCPMCRRIIVHPDGTEEEYHAKPQ